MSETISAAPSEGVVSTPADRQTDAWKKLQALARQIDPTLPTDLSDYEIRITLSKDFQGVELIDRRFAEPRTDDALTR